MLSSQFFSFSAFRSSGGVSGTSRSLTPLSLSLTLCAYFLCADEQGVSGGGVPHDPLLHQHAVVPGMGGLRQGQGQRLVNTTSEEGGRTNKNQRTKK